MAANIQEYIEVPGFFRKFSLNFSENTYCLDAAFDAKVFLMLKYIYWEISLLF